MAELTAAEGLFEIHPLGNGVYLVADDDGARTVYVAGNQGGWWAFCDGHVYTGRQQPVTPPPLRTATTTADAPQNITAPMPATVLKVRIKPGDVVKKGDTLVVLEAMKMELPLRAAGDATVAAVYCREGELVQADAVLVGLT